MQPHRISPSPSTFPFLAFPLHLPFPLPLKKTWFGNCPGLIEISDSFKNLSVVIRSTIRFMLSFTMSKLPLRTDQLLCKSEVKWMNVAIAKVVPIVRVSFFLALRTTPEKVSHILFKFEVKWMNMAMPWQSCTNS